jgi:hypothetical protein
MAGRCAEAVKPCDRERLNCLSRTVLWPEKRLKKNSIAVKLLYLYMRNSEA